MVILTVTITTRLTEREYHITVTLTEPVLVDVSTLSSATITEIIIQMVSTVSGTAGNMRITHEKRIENMWKMFG